MTEERIKELARNFFKTSTGDIDGEIWEFQGPGINKNRCKKAQYNTNAKRDRHPAGKVDAKNLLGDQIPHPGLPGTVLDSRNDGIDREEDK